MTSSYRDPRLEELAGALCEGQLSEVQATELRQLLAAHPGARRLFAQQMQLAYELRSEGTVAGIAPVARPRVIQAPPRRKTWTWAATVAAASIAVAVLIWNTRLTADKAISALDVALNAKSREERDKVFKKFGQIESLKALHGQDVGIVVCFFKTEPHERCEKLINGFSALEEEFRGIGYVILGVSGASEGVLRTLKEKCKPAQTLLSDTEGKLARVMSHRPGDYDIVIIGRGGGSTITANGGDTVVTQWDGGKLVVRHNIDYENEPRVLLALLK